MIEARHRMEEPAGTGFVGILMVALCAAAIVIGWGLVLASLLYVVAGYSTTTWVLTALGLAAGHGVIAAVCWHHAVASSRNLAVPDLGSGF